MSALQERFQNVKQTLLVLSGKGGVGKSTVAVHIANSFVKKGLKVGLLDVDLTGPSIPRLVGLTNHSVHKASEGWVPVYTNSKKELAVMSIGFLLKNESDPIIWRGPKKNAVIKQFLSDVIWEELDVLVIDTPPGTSDEHISTLEYLSQTSTKLSSVIVTTPQAVALSDVRKEIRFCNKLNLSIDGLFENMSGYKCINCQQCTNIFSSEGGKLLAEKLNIPFLGSIPIDAKLAACEDAGENFFEKHSDSNTLESISLFVDNFVTKNNSESTEEMKD